MILYLYKQISKGGLKLEDGVSHAAQQPAVCRVPDAQASDGHKESSFEVRFTAGNGPGFGLLLVGRTTQMTSPLVSHGARSGQA